MQPVGVWGKREQGGYALRFVEVVVAAFLAVWIAVLLGGKANLPRGPGIVKVELAGTADRARQLLGHCRCQYPYVSSGEIHTALAWDFLFIAFYAVSLFFAASYLGRRSFRVRAWNTRARSVGLLAVVAAALDVLENVGIWIGPGKPRGAPAWRDTLWSLVAAAAWAKFVLLFIVLAYVVIAACAYVCTPPWIQRLLKTPPTSNVMLSPEHARDPERFVVEGTPPVPGRRP